MKSEARPALAPLFGAIVRPIQQFFRLEAASGVLLLTAAAAALVWANAAPETYQGVFGTPFTVGSFAPRITLGEVLNDGLMTLFFFLVGMEIKRELTDGELRSVARASLPAVAAVGGMVVPAVIYFAFNSSGPAAAGWGIAMATDIAFSIGILTMLRSRVPHGMVVFLTALAIFDDIGGIVVIALFYGHGLHWPWLLATLAIVVLLLFGAPRQPFARASFHAVAGVLLWYAVLRAGIHPTISGVLLGLCIPGGSSALSEAPVSRYIGRLHPFVAFGIMPLFALANSGVSLRSLGVGDLAHRVTLGVALGLFAGKQAGIFAFTIAAVRLRVAPMPGGGSAMKLLGTAAVGGIGFTVALFIAALAFADQPQLLAEAKLGILLGSLAAGVAGAVILRATPALRDSVSEALIA